MNFGGQYDVVVVGGGPAGVGAALAATRNGAKTLLVEQYGFLGGMWTSAYVAPIVTTHFKDEQVCGGLLVDVIEKLRSINGVIGPLKCPYNSDTTFGTGGYITIFDSEKMRYVLFELIQEFGVDLLLHSFCTDSIKEDNKVCGIEVSNKSGKEIILADVVIDATGDADVSALSGARFNKGDSKNGLTQPMSLMFIMGNVKIEKLKNYIYSNKDDFAWITEPIIKNPIPEGLQQDHIAFSGLFKLVETGKKSGKLHVGRKRLTFFTGLYPGQIGVNATRITGLDGTNAKHLTMAEIDTRKQAISVAKYLKDNVPGFENSFIYSTPSQVGVRETRQIIGKVIITKKDILEGTYFDDTIAKGAFPIDIHQPDGDGNIWEDIKQPYSIPYRALLPDSVDGLIVAGRSISGTHEAMSAFRVTPICFVTGQAAGTAAALAIKSHKKPRDIDIDALRKTLLEQGAII